MAQREEETSFVLNGQQYYYVIDQALLNAIDEAETTTATGTTQVTDTIIDQVGQTTYQTVDSVDRGVAIVFSESGSAWTTTTPQTVAGVVPVVDGLVNEEEVVQSSDEVVQSEFLMQQTSVPDAALASTTTIATPAVDNQVYTVVSQPTHITGHIPMQGQPPQDQQQQALLQMPIENTLQIEVAPAFTPRTPTIHFCSICNIRFNYGRDLKRHMASHCKDKTVICPQCNKAFRTPNNLRNHLHVVHSEKRHGCDYCGKKFPGPYKLKKHMQACLLGKARSDGAGLKMAPVCHVCDAVFTTKVDLYKHLKIHFDGKPFECSGCAQKFSNPDSLRRHLKKAICKDGRGVLSPVSNENVAVNQPDIADTILEVEASPEETPPPEPIVKLPSTKPMSQSISKPHNEDGPVQVPSNHVNSIFMLGDNPIVELRVPENFKPETHTAMPVGEQDRPYPCHICNKRYTTANNLRAHHATVHSERKHECKNCGQKFPLPYKLKKHALICAQGRAKPFNRMHDCEHCEESFKTKRDLQIHLRIHFNGRPFECSICSYRFVSAESLQKHRKRGSCQPNPKTEGSGVEEDSDTSVEISSNGVRDPKKIIPQSTIAGTGDPKNDPSSFSCPLCSKCFDAKDKLVNHLPFHNNTQSHPCPKCGRRFAFKHKLQQHMIEHRKLPYKQMGSVMKHLKFDCKSCGKRFKHEDSLKHHVRKEHVVKLENECKNCGTVCGSKDLLRAHVRIHIEASYHKCAECTEMFATKGSLYHHVASAHKKHKRSLASELFPEEKVVLNVDDTLSTKVPISRQVSDSNSVIEGTPSTPAAAVGANPPRLIYFMNSQQSDNDPPTMVISLQSDSAPGSTPVQPGSIDRGLCRKCGRKFANSYSLQQHMRIHSEDGREIEWTPPKTKLGNRCMKCGIHFASLKDLRDHIVVHLDLKTFKCSFCDKVFSGKEPLKQHVLANHEFDQDHNYANNATMKDWTTADPTSSTPSTDNTKAKEGAVDAPAKGQKQTRVCPICDEIFPSKNKYLRHKKVHRGKKHYICPECGRGHKNLSDLRRHALRHINRYSYPCTLCGKKLSSHQALMEHIARRICQPDEGENRVLLFCPFCNTNTTSHNSMQLHIEKYHPKANYKVQQTKAELEQGSSTASGVKFSNCEKCNDHMLESVTDGKRVRVYKCYACGISFTQMSHLLRHSTLHPSAMEGLSADVSVSKVDMANVAFLCDEKVGPASEMKNHLLYYPDKNLTKSRTEEDEGTSNKAAMSVIEETGPVATATVQETIDTEVQMTPLQVASVEADPESKKPNATAQTKLVHIDEIETSLPSRGLTSLIKGPLPESVAPTPESEAKPSDPEQFIQHLEPLQEISGNDDGSIAIQKQPVVLNAEEQSLVPTGTMGTFTDSVLLSNDLGRVNDEAPLDFLNTVGAQEDVFEEVVIQEDDAITSGLSIVDAAGTIQLEKLPVPVINAGQDVITEVANTTTPAVPNALAAGPSTIGQLDVTRENLVARAVNETILAGEENDDNLEDPSASTSLVSEFLSLVPETLSVSDIDSKTARSFPVPAEADIAIIKDQQKLEKPFYCSQCQERFKTMSELVQHSIIHVLPVGATVVSSSNIIGASPMKIVNAPAMQHVPPLTTITPLDTQLLPQQSFTTPGLGNSPASVFPSATTAEITESLIKEDPKLPSVFPTKAEDQTDDTQGVAEEEKPVAKAPRIPRTYPAHSCQICGMEFLRLKFFKQHVADVHPEDPRPFKCEVCHKEFGTVLRLQRHALVHSGLKPHICSECGECFSRPQQLHEHMNWHSNIKAFQCEECTARFTRAFSLKAHRAIHTSERPWTCSKCGKAFKTEKTMKNHMAIHTLNRPFPCELCPQSFSTENRLHTHKKFHSNPRAYVCHCGKGFPLLKVLKRHRKAVHNESDQGPPANLKCKICNTGFWTNRDLTVHLKGHVKNECGKIAVLNKEKKTPDDTKKAKRLTVSSNKPTEIQILERPSGGLTDDYYIEDETMEQDMPEVDEESIKGTGDPAAWPEVSTAVPPKFNLQEEVNKAVRVFVSEEPVGEEDQPLENNAQPSNTLKIAENTLPIESDAPSPTGSEQSAGETLSPPRTFKINLETVLRKKLNLKCPHCLVTFASKDQFDSHVQTHLMSRPEVCHHCNKGFISTTDLLRHLEESSVEKDVKCTQCDFTFWRRRELIEHTKNQHKKTEKNFLCDKCDQTFVSETLLTRHLATHQEGEGHVCGTCGLVFHEADKLELHLQTHEAADDDFRMFQCADCGKSFKTNHNLQTHTRVHMTVKPFKCDICDKQFAFKQNLQRHIKVHMGQRDHVCSECGKGFVDPQALKRHLTIHTGERNYACVECGRRFATQNRLSEHRKSHGQRKHLCLDCGQCFLYKNTLQQHRLLRHSTEKMFECTKCHEKLQTPKQLKFHISRVHSENPGVPAGKKKKMKNPVVQTVKREPYRRTCQECLKEFLSASAYHKHMAQHKRENPPPPPEKKLYMCSNCGKTSKKKSALKNHFCVRPSAEHNGAYLCHKCDRVFRDTAGLIGHMSKHAREENHIRQENKESFANMKCQRCGLAFTDQGALTDHMLKHVKQDRTSSNAHGFVQCQMCKIFCKGAAGLFEHMATHGKDDSQEEQEAIIVAH